MEITRSDAVFPQIIDNLLSLVCWNSKHMGRLCSLHSHWVLTGNETETFLNDYIPTTHKVASDSSKKVLLCHHKSTDIGGHIGHTGAVLLPPVPNVLIIGLGVNNAPASVVRGNGKGTAMAPMAGIRTPKEAANSAYMPTVLRSMTLNGMAASTNEKCRERAKRVGILNSC